MSADPRRVKDLFVAALDLPDEPARRALLDRECGGDVGLRRRLDVLLAAHDRPDAALDQPLAAPLAPGDAVTRTADTVDEATPDPTAVAGAVVAKPDEAKKWRAERAKYPPPPEFAPPPRVVKP